MRTLINPTSPEVNDHVNFQWPWNLWDSNWWPLENEPKIWPDKLHPSRLCSSSKQWWPCQKNQPMHAIWYQFLRRDWFWKKKVTHNLGAWFTFILFFFFLIYVGCPGQLMRTTTIPHGPLDTLQAQEQVRHREGDRHAHRGSNPGRGRNKSHNWPQQLDPQVRFTFILFNALDDIFSSY